MESNVPARRDESLPVPAGGSPQTAEDERQPGVEQNLAAGLIPLALIALLVLSFVAAAWTFLAALPAS
jgi:hypothetical protein